MNIAEFSIRKNVITWVTIILMTIGGVFAYFNLGRYEDPEYTIKDALVITLYPGATPKEVEEEVTDRIEKAIQQMPQIKHIKSLSKAGYSELTVTIKDKYDKHTLPQVWDELRRKVTDIQSQLPYGAGPSLVNDDFGDVYGMFYAVTGEGYSYKELKHYTDVIKKELSLVKGVAKVQITGDREEAIFVDISHSRISQLGISLKSIYHTLRLQNKVTYAGHVRVGDEYIRIQPSGDIDSVKSISNLLIKSKTSNKLIYLSDIAKISRGYVEVPKNLVYFNNKPALAVGISIVPGGNVVKIGERVGKKIHDMQNVIPVGIRINSIYEQPKIVDQSIKGFMISLIEALAIVVVVLLIAMGFRSGMIIASILLLTVSGTLFFMYLFKIDLERISLGALIIALGMLVDNAIVVTEGILIKIQAGIDKIKASNEAVKQTIWPLLGATIIGILAFAPISLSQDSTGEYTSSLFYVIFISLMLSWYLAITVAPLFCYLFLEQQEKNTDNPYKGKLYQIYRSILDKAIRIRWVTMSTMAALLFAAIFGFGYVKQSFFPDSTTPMFYVDFWHAEGTDIRTTAATMNKIATHLKKMNGITDVTQIVGAGAQRFMLVYEPEKAHSSYGQFLVRVGDYRNIPGISKEVRQYLIRNYPDSEPKIKYIRLGPGGGSKIEIRISGTNENKLREISEHVQNIMRNTPGAIDIRDDWRQRVKIIKPIYSETQARRSGITRAALSAALETAFTGRTVGYYRETDKLIPIISRPPDNERLNIATIDDLQIWSPLLDRTIPIAQVVSSFKTEWTDAIIHRRNRKMTITASAEPLSGPSSTVFNKIRAQVEKVKLPPGYHIEWGGEYENSHDAQVALAKKLPIGFISMFLITLLLFSAVRQALIIWLTVPLAAIGVTLGLLTTHTEFGFMALLGFLSLSGMLIKNAIVLVDQTDTEVAKGLPPYNAILDSAVSRFRPVILAAVTTVLGMIPLLFDAFFKSMSIVIMYGLSFATILTLIVVPTLYAIFFQVPATTRGDQNLTQR